MKKLVGNFTSLLYLTLGNFTSLDEFCGFGTVVTDKNMFVSTRPRTGVAGSQTSQTLKKTRGENGEMLSFGQMQMNIIYILHIFL